MGVKGLWRLIECAGVPVPVETLEKKILAVDVSIWLHQAVRGFKGVVSGGQANAPLLTLFHRICKLLFYRIRPIFIFDGGVPHLKKQTLASRRLRREVAANRAKQVRERLLNNLLRSQAVRSALGKSGPGPSLNHVAKPIKQEKDMFELPPLPQPLSNKPKPETTQDSSETNIKTEEEDSEDETENHMKDLNLPNLHQFEFESDAFQKLPIDARHEILTELQDTRKQDSWSTLNQMPQELECFAEFQMGRLRKRRKFQETLDKTRDEIRKKVTEEMESEMFGELEKYVSHSQRVISEDATHSILVKKIRDTGDNEEKNDDNEGAEGKVEGNSNKGKSPAKKQKRGIDKDFLTELAKQGVLRSQPESDSESEWEDDSDLTFSQSDDEGRGGRMKQNSSVDEASFLKVVGSLMENSGLTQEEILALIKQEEQDNKSPHKPGSSSINVSKKHDGLVEGPSTSSQAAGFVFNPDADSSSSDSDDFVEVPTESVAPPSSSASQSSPPFSSLHSDLPSSGSQSLILPSTTTITSFPSVSMKENNSKKEVEPDNLNQLLGTKNNSLWMKIVQQKLDDMVHVNALKHSSKALIDSRQIYHDEALKKDEGRRSVVISAKGSNNMLERKEIQKDTEVKPLKAVKISLDFDVKPLKMEDDIFADIFTDIHCISPSVRPQMKKQTTSKDKKEEIDKVEMIKEKEKKELLTTIKNGHNPSQVLTSSDASIAEHKTNKVTPVTIPNYISNETKKTSSSDSINHGVFQKNTKNYVAQNKIVPCEGSLETRLQNKVSEEVRIETEKFINVNLAEHSVISKGKNSPEKIADQVMDEIMSSSCESEEDEENPLQKRENRLKESSLATVLSNENLKTVKNIHVPDGLTQLPSVVDEASVTDDDDDDDDFIDVMMEEANQVEIKEKEQNKFEIKEMRKNEDNHEVVEKINTEELVENEIQLNTRKKCEKEIREEDKNKVIENMGNQSKDSVITVEDQDKDDRKRVEKMDTNIAGIECVHSSLKESKILRENCVQSEETIEIGTTAKSEGQENNQQTRKEVDLMSSQSLSLPHSPELEEEGELGNNDQVERPLNYTEDELKHLEGELAKEQDSLVAQAEKSNRLAADLNQQTYGESQHLLQLFGIPYLVAPMEAEAQCGFLDDIKLTAGTITDDSDIFLFGGTKVYKNFFNQNKHVEFFKVDNITTNIGLDRNKMISLAMLTGSDYTEGVESVGGVAALEVLAEFPGEGVECLKNLRKWWNVAHRSVTPMYSSKVRQKMSQVKLSESFPNEQVYDAYLNPEVDESKEKFTWAVPNVEALRQFTGEKFGWSRAKTDEILGPVMKRLGLKTSQMRIDSFFTNIKLVKEGTVTSKRVQDAIAKVKGGKVSDNKLTLMRKKAEGKPGRPNNKKRKIEEEREEMTIGDGERSNVEDSNIIVKRVAPSKVLLIDPSEAQQVNRRRTNHSSKGKVTKQGTKRKSKEEENKSKQTGKRTKCVDDDDEEEEEEEEGEALPAGNIESIVRKGRRTQEIFTAEKIEKSGRKLTKEIMFNALLEKEKISQREEEERIMKERKKYAAELLKSHKHDSKKKGKR
ncbi:hypothetical protein Pmani_017797 [Petrolisthes manimaculis]|uniref:DNA repair protein complementing XP-G cells n=1 Tax=Petrolisthes manimaculis TaxID=1843537 RepID=A0AAE1PLF8_9EUCA|nr:hypothetical protein Pmani_017797 [Petrolisthes manimaculis]